jgi:hypothetical protein
MGTTMAVTLAHRIGMNGNGPQRGPQDHYHARLRGKL